MSDKEKYPSEAAERFQLRLPDGLRDRIKSHAERHGRSMNTEIVRVLERAFGQKAVASTLPADAPLEDRLAECLAACIDTALLTVRDTMNDWPVELRLGSFNREISERAAELLGEAGR